MLKNDIGVHEVERAIGEHAKAGVRGDVRVGMRDIFELFAGQPDHFVGDIHPVDFAEMPAHGPHQPAGPTADLECAAAVWRSRRQARKFRFQCAGNFRRAGQEFLLLLAAPPERHIEVQILARAAIPVGAHLLVHVHGSMVSSSMLIGSVALGVLRQYWGNGSIIFRDSVRR